MTHHSINSIYKNNLINSCKNNENLNNYKIFYNYNSDLIGCLDDLIKKSKAHHHYQEEVIKDLKISINNLKKKLNDQEGEDARRLAQSRPAVLSDNQCCICMSRPNNHAYIGCGHMCVCGPCAERWGNKCPICKTNSSVIKIYNS
jgi:hypothetical protein|tara:strand:+ start:412 stop:846 length:435 start_codon:yes stop_codon:yes gene_type:complete